MDIAVEETVGEVLGRSRVIVKLPVNLEREGRLDRCGSFGVLKGV